MKQAEIRERGPLTVHGSISKDTSFGNSWLEKQKQKIVRLDSEYIYIYVKYFDKQSLDPGKSQDKIYIYGQQTRLGYQISVSWKLSTYGIHNIAQHTKAQVYQYKQVKSQDKNN